MLPARLDEITDAVIGAFPKLSSGEQRISLAIYRRLAQGRPASIADIAAAARVGVAEVEATIRPWPGIHYDGAGAVIAYWGLALSKMRHRLRVDGRDLYVWCAWDALFIPMLLEQDGGVESECPVSKERISLLVSERGVEPRGHPGAAVSFVAPRQDKIEQDVIRNFCHFVHFFASTAHGERWTAEHPGTFLLTLDDAWELGRRKNAAQYRDALAAPMAARTVSVEFFFAGGCSACARARQALRETALFSPRVEWLEVDVGKNPRRAVDAGVVGTPAVAIDGDLVFKTAPAPAELRSAIEARLSKGRA